MKTEVVHPSLEGFIAYLMADPVSVFGLTAMLAIGASCIVAELLCRSVDKSNRRGRY